MDGMEIRAFAERVLLSEELEEKLRRPEAALTDLAPGDVLNPAEPGRPADLRFAGRKQAPVMPRAAAFADPRKRAIAHHIMANHELQAAEVMAWVLCRFPEAPPEFRSGLVRILQDEQRHTRMHMERAAALGITFGELPVNSYIWKKAREAGDVLEYLAGLPLTFEGRNLDHTLEFEEAFRAVGDVKSAAIMRAIHEDEIHHLAFGLEWLRRLKPEGESDWDAYERLLKWPLRPSKSRGETFHRAPRLAAGMSEDFVDRLERAEEADERS